MTNSGSSLQHHSNPGQSEEYEFICFDTESIRPISIDLGSTREHSNFAADDDISLLSRKPASLKSILEPAINEAISGDQNDTRQPQSGTQPRDPWLERMICSFGHVIVVASTIMLDHNPFKATGRTRIKNFASRSGPAYQIPDMNASDGAAVGYFTGWRMGALYNMVLLIVCLLAEITMLLVAVGLDRSNSEDSDSTSLALDGIIHTGKCRNIKRLTIPIALLVNIVATLTIGSSNYMMQCFSAPTGKELREAHNNGNFLRIGVSSPMNVDFVSKKKTAMWWIMGVTSVPVHLLFNSAFYSTLQANNYAIAIFTSDFQDAQLWNQCFNNDTAEDSWSDLTCQLYQQNHADPVYNNISATECVQRYSDPLIYLYSNVILVSSVTSALRNQSLKFMCKRSSEVTLENSSLSFTTRYLSDGDAGSSKYSFDPKLAGFDGLLGIYTAYGYAAWDDLYRNRTWYLNTTAFATYIMEFTMRNGTTLTGSQYKDRFDPTDDDLIGNFMLLDGTEVFGGPSSNSGIQGMIPARLRAEFDPTIWLCHDNTTSPCTEQTALQNIDNWRVSPFDIPISYCLSQNTPKESCEIRYSMVILCIVIFCDIVKILVILLALRSSDRPLVTVGDVISFFLQNREPLTEKRCLLTQRQVRSEDEQIKFALSRTRDEPCWSETCFPIDFSKEEAAYLIPRENHKKKVLDELFYQASPTVWKKPKLRWCHAVSKIGWLYLLSIILTAVTVTVTIFAIGFENVKTSGGGSIWSRGLFKPDPNSLYTSTTKTGAISTFAFLWQVMIVNAPQLFFSMMYFTYNGTFTIMHSADEWAGFATERKALRVSEPKSGQSSTYWLNLPWSYSLPLIAISALLHWMVSQSLYLVSIKVYGPYGTLQEDQNIFACGFSTVMLLMVFVLLLGMSGMISGFSVRPLKGDIPLVGANSLAISAVCHDPNISPDEAYKELLWGMTKKPEGGQPGHCALSSGKVEKPVEGQLYQ